MRLPNLIVPMWLRLAITGVTFVYAAVSVWLDIPALVSLGGRVLLLLLIGASAIAVGTIIVGQGREIQRLREKATNRLSARRKAVGDALVSLQRLDREIMALKGDARREPGKYAERLETAKGAALSCVREHYPEREGYYLSDATLPVTTGVVTGWRDVYVAELRRRIVRLNELQQQDH